MNSGIYHVTFKSGHQSFGEGIAVIKNGTVNGGDHGYLYLGTFKEEAGKISSELQIKKWVQDAVSVFGPIANFTLKLSGTISPDGVNFTVAGGVLEKPGFTITIHGKRVSEAA